VYVKYVAQLRIYLTRTIVYVCILCRLVYSSICLLYVYTVAYILHMVIKNLKHVITLCQNVPVLETM